MQSKYSLLPRIPVSRPFRVTWDFCVNGAWKPYSTGPLHLREVEEQLASLAARKGVRNPRVIGA